MSDADFGFIDLDVCNGKGVQSVKYVEQTIRVVYNDGIVLLLTYDERRC